MNSNKDQNNEENFTEESNNVKESIEDENILNEESNNVKESIKDENILNEEINNVKESRENEKLYKFGWSKYSELTNGRFAMLGFLAIILIEFLSKKTFLHWSGLL